MKKLFKKLVCVLFVGIAIMLVSCSSEGTYEYRSSKIEKSKVVTDLTQVNAELLATAPSHTRGWKRWSDEEKAKVVLADVVGAWSGCKSGARIGASVGMGLGSPLTGGAFGAFLGAVVGGAFSSWMAAPSGPCHELAAITPQERPSDNDEMRRDDGKGGAAIDEDDEVVIDGDVYLRRITRTCRVLVNENMSVNESAICLNKSNSNKKLNVDEDLIVESKLDEASLEVGKIHNIVLSVMEDKVLLKDVDLEQSDRVELKDALLNSEELIKSCKAQASNASTEHISETDPLLDEVLVLFEQVFKEYATNTGDVAFIIGKYVEVIDGSTDLTTEQKRCIKSGLATALYSSEYWEDAFADSAK